MRARRDGRLLPLREIEARVVPTMQGAQYIGVDFDAGTGVYTLKFLRDGVVIWVDVDGRSGQVIGRTGRDRIRRAAARSIGTGFSRPTGCFLQAASWYRGRENR